MKYLAITAIALAAFAIGGSTRAEAGGIQVRIGGYGYGGGYGYRSNYYGRSYGYGGGYVGRPRGHYDYHDTSHYDVTPGYSWRHGNHYHYEPPTVRYHQQGHWDYHVGPHYGGHYGH